MSGGDTKKPDWSEHQESIPMVAKKWLWEPWIPEGSIGICAGDPGVGKTTAMYDIMCRLSRGDKMIDGWQPPAPISCLAITLEETKQDIVRPRLKFMEGHDIRVISQHSLPTFPRDIPRLQDSILEHGSKLVIIDPMWKAIHSSENMNDNQRISQVMMQFSKVAEETASSIIFIHHLNKNALTKGLYRSGGAMSIMGSARFSFGVAKHPDDPDLTIFGWYKGNISSPKKCPTHVFRTGTCPPPYDYIPLPIWVGAEPEISVGDVFAGLDSIKRLQNRPMPPKNRVQIWLGEYFDRVGDEPQDVQLIFELGKEMGFSKDEIQAARTKCGISSQIYHSAQGKRYMWQRVVRIVSVH